MRRCFAGVGGKETKRACVESEDARGVEVGRRAEQDCELRFRIHSATIDHLQRERYGK